MSRTINLHYWPGMGGKKNFGDELSAFIMGKLLPLNDFVYNKNRQKIVWNRETREYNTVEIDNITKIKLINYLEFWNLLLDSFVYTRLKNLSKESLEVNVLLTEFIALISDAKSGNANIQKIQDSILDLLDVSNFTEEELVQIYNIFVETGMNNAYVLSRDALTA